MGTSCFVTVTTDFCFKSPTPLFELSIFFLFTVKFPLFNLGMETFPFNLLVEKEPSFTGFMSFTFDEAFPLLLLDPRERKYWAQIKDGTRPHHDHLPLLPFTGDKRERTCNWGSDMVTLAPTP
ncbi:hypothetical protein AMTRI_Chr10g3760 [Amborella trichopoda]